jgi:rfaE bifunctional protein nucleotidyltransferase chain/domain
LKATPLLKEKEIRNWRSILGKSFTPAIVVGTFDILHPGNLTVLEKAASISKAVCVVLEPDAPSNNARQYSFITVNPLALRMGLVSHLKQVSAVASFSSEKMEHYFQLMRPYKLVDCGANYSKAPIRVYARKNAETICEVPAIKGSFTKDIDEAINKGKSPIKVAEKINNDEKEAALKQILEQRKSEGKRIVTVNGCFDILHIGHMALLETARSRGDYLIVLVNDDDSVRSYKGEKRPIFPIHFRIRALEATSHVALALPFSGDTPLEMLARIKPDIHVKGGSYEPERVKAETDLLKQCGGTVEFVPLVEGHSTTNLIQKYSTAKGDKL